MEIAASTGLLTASGLPSTPEVSHFRLLAELGFEWVDFSDIWAPLSELSAGDVDRLRAATEEAGLKPAGTSIIGFTPRDFAHDPVAFRARAERALDNATRLGSPLVSVGLHGAPPGGITGGTRPPWLTQGGPPDHSDEAVVVAAHVVGLLADLAAERGQSIHLEMNEGSVLDTGASSLAVQMAAGRANVGQNPDVVNVLRAPWPLQEDWRTTLRTVAPHVRYWHVKNCHRIEMENGRATSTHSSLAEGVMDYRFAVRLMREAGFDGFLVVEHYGGDVLWFAAQAHRHLSEIVAAQLASEVGRAPQGDGV